MPDPIQWRQKGGRVQYHADGSTTFIDWSNPPISVRYSPQGYPDFSRFVYHDHGTVQITQTGNNAIDFLAANAVRGKPQPPGWTWHHKEDGMTMELIPTEINTRFSHTGGASISRGAN